MQGQLVRRICKGCGAELDNIADNRFSCGFCGSRYTFDSFSNVAQMPVPQVQQLVMQYRQDLTSKPESKELNTSVAMCFLRLKQYDHALRAFEKVMETNFDNSEVFFYAAVCLLQGKIPFLHLRPTIDKILSYVESALMIQDKGIYHYFLAYIKLDYFKRKFLNVSPNYTQHLAQARQSGYTEAEVTELFQILGVSRPQGL